MRAFAQPFTAGPVWRARRPCRAVVVVVRAAGLGGVEDLLARDRKQPKLAPELSGDKPVEQVLQQFETAEVKAPAQVKNKRQRRAALVERTDRPAAAEVPDSSRPKRCKEAIDRGLALFQEKKYNDAVAMFNLALELPGNGAYRLANSPREYSCPSDAEESAALYNMACAYAQMGERVAAITCLEAILENGFEDFQTIRSDPDLAPLRGAGLNDLLGKYDNPVAKLKKALSSKKEEVSDTKPWILW